MADAVAPSPANGRMQANLRHIAAHEAKPNPKPLAATSVTRGFEAAAYPKIVRPRMRSVAFDEVRELKDSSLVVRQKSLLAARELLGSGVSYVQCIAAGITPAVVALMTDEDTLVRERAAGTAQYIATKEVGAADLRQHGGVAALVALLEDVSPGVKDAAYNALIEAARFNGVRTELMSLKTALPRLMALVLQEDEGRSLRGLQLLNACVQVRDPKLALQQLVDDAVCIPSLSKLVDAGRPQHIQEQACQLLALVTSIFDDAKTEAVSTGCVPKLLALLGQGADAALASAAAAALMDITIVRDGKYAVVRTPGGLATLTQRLAPGQATLCVRVCQVVANVSEAPEARGPLAELGAGVALAGIHSDASNPELVRRSAAEALRQCRFEHRPYQPLPGRTVDPNEFPAKQAAAT